VRDEIIEDSMTNTITRRLPQLVADHYKAILPAIAALATRNRTSAAVISEMLKQIGRLRDADSYFDRRWVLEHALSSRNPAARDGAAVGLAWLGDPSSATYGRQRTRNEFRNSKLISRKSSEFSANPIPMALLRKITKAKWLDPDWLPPGELPGDALVDLRTQNNELSVWRIEPDNRNLDDVIAALASNKTGHVDKFDYVLLDDAVVERLGIDCVKRDGDSPHGDANVRCGTGTWCN
jgi:hypothetical protein